MNNIKKGLLITVLFCSAVLSYGQKSNAASQLKLIRDAYVNNKQLSFDVEVYSFHTPADKTPDLVSKGYVRKKDGNYYSSFFKYELLIIGEKALMVNNENKTMKYYNYKMAKQKDAKEFEIDFESLFSKSDSVVVHPPVGGEKHFTFFSKNGYIRQTEFYVNASTNLVSHILYYYAPSTEEYEIEVDRVEVFYKNSKTANVDESHFTFDKYLKVSKSAVKPVGKYLNYRVNS